MSSFNRLAKHTLGYARWVMETRPWVLYLVPGPFLLDTISQPPWSKQFCSSMRFLLWSHSVTYWIFRNHELNSTFLLLPVGFRDGASDMRKLTNTQGDQKALELHKIVYLVSVPKKALIQSPPSIILSNPLQEIHFAKHPVCPHRLLT